MHDRAPALQTECRPGSGAVDPYNTDAESVQQGGRARAMGRQISRTSEGRQPVHRRRIAMRDDTRALVQWIAKATVPYRLDVLFNDMRSPMVHSTARDSAERPPP